MESVRQNQVKQDIRDQFSCPPDVAIENKELILVSLSVPLSMTHHSPFRKTPNPKPRFMPFPIRLAQLDDVPELQRVIAASARGLSTDRYTPEQIEGALKYVFGVDTQLIADQTYFVVESAGRMAGCGGWSKRKTLFGGDQMKKDKQDPLLDPTTEPARIRAFFVHPNWARKGVGGLILETCEAEARKAGFSEMEMAATLPGEPLYARFGYEVVERFDIPLPDGTLLPVARMSKRL